MHTPITGGNIWQPTPNKPTKLQTIRNFTLLLLTLTLITATTTGLILATSLLTTN